MIPIVDPERVTQNRIINLLHKNCGYKYLGYKQDDDNSPIIQGELEQFLHDSGKYSATEIGKAIREIELEIFRCHDKDSLFESNLNI